MKGGKPKSQAKNAALSVNKKAAATATKARSSTKKDKMAKDPAKPKRPPSAFFVFMEDFRVQYKEKHPQNKAVSVVGKAGGDKWKSLSDAFGIKRVLKKFQEKAPYISKAEKRKADYEKSMKAYNKRQAEGTKGDDEESEKSMSEVNNEDEEEDDAEDEEDDDDE